MDNSSEKQIKQLEKEITNLKKMVLMLSQRLTVSEKVNRRLVLASERAQNQINAITRTLGRE